MNTITPDELSALPDATLIDVRERHEYEAGHAPTAVNIPLSEIADRVAEVPRDGIVYVICESGGRSGQVVDWLEPQGYDVVNVLGGTSAWRAAGHAVSLGG